MNIRLRIIFLLCMLSAATISWSQEKFRARVVDATTGEPLPYAHIYVSKDNGAISDYDGFFTIETRAETVLRISYMGYNPVRVKAGEMRESIQLKPLGTTIQEVTVLSAETILKRMMEKLYKEYRRRSKAKSNYFLRLTNSYGERQELVEAYLTSRSAINLRNISFLKGMRALNREYAQGESRVSYSNLHHLMEAAPLMMDAPAYWDALKKPLTILVASRGYSLGNGMEYKTSIDDDRYRFVAETMFTEQDEKIYKIRIQAEWKKAPYIEGVLYINGEDYRPMGFEGQLHNFALDVGRDFRQESSAVEPTVSITYSHERGFTEVESVVTNMATGDLQSHLVAYNMGKRKLPFKKGKKASENLAESIDKAGYDPKLWSKAIVPRTVAEEEFIRRQTLSAEDAAQWQFAEKESTYANAGAFRPYMERLTAFGKTIPQEKVYIHMDNTCYFQGDTIWFAAYTRNTNTDEPSDVSGVLYVELWNDDGYLVERKLIEMKQGRGNGFFALNNPIQYSGFYELRAYTRWQLNWGLFEHKHSKVASKWFFSKEYEKKFYRDYEKLYSRVFPVYDRPKEAGDYTRDMTLRIMRRTFKNDPDAPVPTLTFFPEGGNLIAGVPNRVAFEATMSDGEWLEGSLNSLTPTQPHPLPLSGERGDSILTLNRGRGVFTIVPEAGREYKMTFTTPDGESVKAKLPKAEAKGVAIQVNQEGDSIFIRMQMAGLSTDSLAMTIMHEGKVEKFVMLNNPVMLAEGKNLPESNRSFAELRMTAKSLRCGVNQVTVFDAQGHVYADRLFFITKQDEMEPTLTVSGMQYDYLPYDSIGLDIQGKAANTAISLAVRDKMQQDQLFDNADIMTEMLLSSEIRGFVPNPGWFFEQEDDEHREALDLLMMTQGWRRFNWRDMAIRGEWQLSQPDERLPIIDGMVWDGALPELEDVEPLQEVFQAEDMIYEMELKNKLGGENQNLTAENKAEIERLLQQRKDEREKEWNEQTQKILKKKKKKQGREVRVHGELVEPGNREVMVSEVETRQRNFRLQLPRFYGKYIFFLDAADTTKWKKRTRYHWVRMQDDEDLRRPNWTIKTYLRWLSTEGQMPEFNVTVDFPYPRFVKPYTFHRRHLYKAADPEGTPASLLADSIHVMREVTVRTRRGRLRGFDQSQPAFAVDYAEAHNLKADAGLGVTHIGYHPTIVRVFCSDYGSDYPYVSIPNIPPQFRSPLEVFNENMERIYVVYGLSATRRALPQYIDIPTDSLYHQKYLRTLGRGFKLSPGEEINREFSSSKLDKYVIYTDYCPRLEGSKRYQGSNLPETRIALYPYYDGSARVLYMNRRYILDGFAYPAEFYNPDYSRQRPQEPTDYRRTLYWNPSLQLDEQGRAHVTLYNNCRMTQISVSAAGQAENGQLLWNK